MLYLGDQLGASGREFSQWALEEMQAWGKAAYRFEDSRFVPMLTDGTSLEGYVFKRDSYFGKKKGDVIQAVPSSPRSLWAYAAGCRASGGDAFLWKVARNIAQFGGFGEFGEAPGEPGTLNLQTDDSSTEAAMAFLELHRWTGQAAFLSMAARIGRNILARSYRDGYFLEEKDCINSELSAVEPLVLLAIAERLEGKGNRVPAYFGGRSYFHDGNIYDRAMYSLKRGETVQ